MALKATIGPGQGTPDRKAAGGTELTFPISSSERLQYAEQVESEDGT